VLEERYGVMIEDKGNARIFASVRRLAEFVRTRSVGPAAGKD
jgi:hypothetical protein